MKDRTIQILAALITEFIDTAQPIASKKLLASNDFNISSATVRNEFAVLESVGLIESPHVSAGKIPTEKGYRFFVDTMIAQDDRPTPKAQKNIQTIFQKHLSEYRYEKTREMVFDAMRLMASLSGNIAFATLDNDRTFYLGLSNVLRLPEFVSAPEKAAQIIEVLEGKSKFHELLTNLNLPEKDVQVFIGEENILDEVNSCAMIVVRFETKYASGHLGILGPMRMRYKYNRELVRNLLEMIY
jgi:transcriptional regulator of heat shock response